MLVQISGGRLVHNAEPVPGQFRSGDERLDRSAGPRKLVGRPLARWRDGIRRA